MKNILALLLSFLFFIVSAEAVTLELQDVRLVEYVRVVYGQIIKRPFILDTSFLDCQDKVTVSLDSDPAKIETDALNLLELHGFQVSHRAGVIFIRKREEKDNQEILVYKPLFRSSSYLTDIVTNVITEAHSSMQSVAVNSLPSQNPNLPNQNSSVQQFNPSVFNPHSTTGDQVVLNVSKDDYKKVQKLLADLDTAPGEILLKAAVYEVGNSKSEGGAFRLAASLLKGKYGATLGTTIAATGASALHVAVGGLDMVLATLDQDSRFKTVSRPMVRVRSGSQARFAVGQDVPVLGQAQLDKNGNPVQAIEYKQSGTILTVTPDVHESVVDLDIQQEVSSFVATTTGVNNSPTLLKRTVHSNLAIKPGEVAAFAGLNETKHDETTTRLFGFKLGNTDNDGDTEILVFVEVQRI